MPWIALNPAYGNTAVHIAEIMKDSPEYDSPEFRPGLVSIIGKLMRHSGSEGKERFYLTPEEFSLWARIMKYDQTPDIPEETRTLQLPGLGSTLDLPTPDNYRLPGPSNNNLLN